MRVGEQEHIEHGVIGQLLLFDRHFEQRRLELVIGFIRKDGLGLGLGLKALSYGCRSAHQVGIFRDIANDGCARILQERAKRVIEAGARLNDVTAGIVFGAQVRRDQRPGRLGGVDQGIFQENGFVIAARQLADGFGGVAEPIGKLRRLTC